MTRRTLALLALFALAACSDPASRIAAPDAPASQTGMLGSGTRTEEGDDDECLAAGGYLGSGNVTGCTPPPPGP